LNRKSTPVLWWRVSKAREKRKGVKEMFARKGQSTLEYVIVLTAIIAVVIAVAAGVLKTKTQQSLEHVATEMAEQVNNIDYGKKSGTQQKVEPPPPANIGGRT
jgi:uncharacterized protein (UPF0333 family)